MDKMVNFVIGVAESEFKGIFSKKMIKIDHSDFPM